MRADDGSVMRYLRAPDAQEDRRAFGKLPLHAGCQDFLVVVHVVADRANDLLGTWNHRQEGDVFNAGVSAEAFYMLGCILVFARRNVVEQAWLLGASLAEVDNAVSHDGSPGFATFMLIGQQFHWNSS
ncbi:hypothetical protein D3C72_1852930 [compost metagenome]